ncbi:hypothetical protein DSO57_1037133 [Entomophthora muscae]|uniref:Uncharacterized protein n=1 Tax=Entomophthora muscae TaxID=34485 RepID=A0ACC2S193_9FUNG|nr:hypothetical protein DSO57_1037133 [Entomophthora muscae]
MSQYRDTETPLNVTLLGDKVGYRIDSMDKLGQALEDVAKLTSHSTAQDVQHLVNELSLAALFTLLVASSHQESLTESVHTICRNYLVTLPTV